MEPLREDINFAFCDSMRVNFHLVRGGAMSVLQRTKGFTPRRCTAANQDDVQKVAAS